MVEGFSGMIQVSLCVNVLLWYAESISKSMIDFK